MSSTRPPDIKIAIMGPTGTGKSSLIQLITGDQSIKVGHSIESETSDIALAHYFEPDGRCITFVDTPGFDDSREGVTDTVILQRIAAFLEAEYKDGETTLNGIIYLHRITDPRMGGITVRNLKMFEKLCGSASLQNVIIVTTRWDKVDKEEGTRREHELMSSPNFFQPLVAQHARFLRHDGTSTSAKNIMLQLLSNQPIVLEIQHELASGTRLEDTQAGTALTSEMNELLKKHKEELVNLKKEMDDAISAKDDELKTELEEEREKLNKAMEKWKTDRGALEEGFESVRLSTRTRMDMSSRHLEGLRPSFLPTDPVQSHSPKSDTASLSSTSLPPLPPSHTNVYGINRPHGNLEHDEGMLRSEDVFNTEHLSLRLEPLESSEEAQRNLEKMIFEFRQSARGKAESDLKFEDLRKELCRISAAKIEEDHQWQGRVERLLQAVMDALAEQKITAETLRRWRSEAISRYRELELSAKKQRHFYDVEIRGQGEEISVLRSKALEEQRLREISQVKLKELHAACEDQRRTFLKDFDEQKSTYEISLGKQGKEISSLRSELSEEHRRREESESRAKREREEFEVTVEKQRLLLIQLKEKSGADSDRHRKEVDAAFEKQRQAFLTNIEEQKTSYENLLEKQKKDISRLGSDLTEEVRRREEFEARAKRERRELEVMFENERRRMQLDMEREKSIYEYTIEKQKKENSKLDADLSEETRRRRESEAMAERKYIELVSTSEAQRRMILDDKERQKSAYEKQVENLRSENTTLRSELSEELRRRKEFQETVEKKYRELEAAFESQRSTFVTETQKQKAVYEGQIEKLRKEISVLDLRLSEENNRRNEIEARAETERKELEAAIEKQHHTFQDTLQEQRTSYEKLVQDQNEEIERLQTELSRKLRILSENEFKHKELEDALSKQVAYNEVLRKQSKDFEALVKNLNEDVQSLSMELSKEKGEAHNLESLLSEEKGRFIDFKERALHDQEELKNEHERKLDASLSELQKQKIAYDEMVGQRENLLDGQREEISALGLKISEKERVLTELEALAERDRKESDRRLKDSEQWWQQLLDIEVDRTKAAERMLTELTETTSKVEPPITSKRPDIMIAIMGPTGTGKSSFIQHLTGDRNIKIGHGVQSETAEIRLAHYFEPDGRCVTLVDTPGFDDSRKEFSDTEILKKLAAFLETEFKHGKKLSGVVYLHRISDVRVGGVSARNLRMFGKLCGEDALKNVAIVTTRWDEVDTTEGESREKELKGNSNFKPLVRAGAQFFRHDGTRPSAAQVMKFFVGKEPIALEIQTELSKGTSLEATAAGSELTEQMNELIQNHRKELESMRHRLKAEIQKSDELGRENLEQVRQDLEFKMKKMEKDKNQLADDLESVRKQALTQRKLEEQRLASLGSLEKVKATIRKLRESYQELARKLEQTSYDRETADFWERRRQHSGKELSVKPDTIDPFNDLIRQMLQLGLEHSSHDPGHEPLIALMGQTGTGKSSFIRLLTGDESVHIGHSVESETTEITQHCYFQDDGRCVTLVDTPGFDDSRAGEGVTDVAILRKLSNFILKNLNGRKLNGIIYLHRITDNRVGGAHTRIMQMFGKLCGPDALRNVAFVTTRWDAIKDEVEGLSRERQLVQNPKFMKPFLDGGARMLRHTGSFGSARRIVAKVLDNVPVEIQFQRELAAGLKLEDTEVGSALGEEIRKLVQKHETEIRKLREEMQEAISRNDLKWKTELENERDSLMQVIKKLKAGEKQLGERFKSDLSRAGLSIDELEQRHRRH